eukprot:TRINITY_DN4666_c0_g1_i1.p1 TRINITY_DN4666_c0_g1~~TRINITY_DN4666_c0_g1_i1.p1  ORF type:complete len:786 (+),score=257.04 TRINITY_DN4666_c0_g1_i1:60-2360(+)
MPRGRGKKDKGKQSPKAAPADGPPPASPPAAAAAPAPAPAPASAPAPAPAPAPPAPPLPARCTAEQVRAYKSLVELGQEHLVAGWRGEEDAAEKVGFLEQIRRLDGQYPGGLAGYQKQAKKLLTESRDGVNPFDGYKALVPEGIMLKYPSPEFERLEKLGVGEMARAAVVLVAGGLGERLGYGGIKIELPTETVTGMCYIQWYLRNLSALAAVSGAKAAIPMAIMTSDDTHGRTKALLERNKYFGYPEDRVYLMKQEKVPSIDNSEGRFVLCSQHNSSGSKYELETKPHGHGDVHSLLLRTGIAQKWAQEGRNWVVFMQDTNAMVFNCVPATLGLSVERDFEVNSICIPRKPKEAIGGIARLVGTKPGLQQKTVNVEYNQLEPLLLSDTGKGDVADETGCSPFPGNTNSLVFRLPEYLATLERTQGMMPEFVNPKYKDAAKTEFKKPTRLECMMQDYPHVLGPDAKVGFTTFDRWFGFSPVKNNVADAVAKAADGLDPNCASSGEADVYHMQAERLRAVGGKLPPAEAATKQEFIGVPVPLLPRVCADPSFAPTHAVLATRIGEVQLAEESTLVVSGEVVLKQLTVAKRSAVFITAAPGAFLTVARCTVQNEGVELVPLSPAELQDKAVPEVIRIRGYRTEVRGCLRIAADKEGRWVYDDSGEGPALVSEAEHEQRLAKAAAAAAGAAPAAPPPKPAEAADVATTSAAAPPPQKDREPLPAPPPPRPQPESNTSIKLAAAATVAGAALLMSRSKGEEQSPEKKSKL